MRTFFFLLLLFSVSLLNAQRLETKKILEVADSIFLSNVNEDIFKLFEVSVGSFYKYQKLNKSTRTGKFLSHKKLKQRVTEIWVLYQFNYPEVKGIYGGTWVRLNNNLELIEDVDLNYIPDFIYENKPCNFLTIQQALEIGIEKFDNQGIEIKPPVLRYDSKYGIYTYYIGNILTKETSQSGRDYGKKEILILDAVTGEILERTDSYYGLIVR